SAGDSIQHSRDHRAPRRGEPKATRVHARDRPDDADAEPQPPGAGSFDRACSAPRGRIKVMKLTSKGRRALEEASALGPRSGQGAGGVGYEPWADAQGLLGHLLRVAVKKRRPIRGQSRVQLSRAREEGV